MANFKLRIIEQKWIDDNPENAYDLCSYGSIYLEIGGSIISDAEDDWTINTAGLELLKSAISDHFVNSSTRPIFDHCGQLAMLGCPISTNWDVRHKGEEITICNITKISSIDRGAETQFKDIEVTILKVDYLRQIIMFCDNIKLFFSTHRKRVFRNDYDKTEFESFWNEFDRSLDICRHELTVLKNHNYE
ncbi:hypothetical protein CH373_06125 [Leptospira perolatii]|uniref:Uncharacterized protein n=1 Tax=Leptospira perolatii TaxID=2023191 RepID=A0A2M9ZNS6_9LEPT|nr:hypothetical protein [Leptospira perolatii]PJZ70844.1 hypothetical protein CH360_04855 [Leptospira perolatii]PJZ73740.1 hypothetical protein CH373_06125 [Leptospira perolatii]